MFPNIQSGSGGGAKICDMLILFAIAKLFVNLYIYCCLIFTYLHPKKIFWCCALDLVPPGYTGMNWMIIANLQWISGST